MSIAKNHAIYKNTICLQIPNGRFTINMENLPVPIGGHAYVDIVITSVWATLPGGRAVTALSIVQLTVSVVVLLQGDKQSRPGALLWNNITKWHTCRKMCIVYTENKSLGNIAHRCMIIMIPSILTISIFKLLWVLKKLGGGGDQMFQFHIQCIVTVKSFNLKN